MPSQRPSGPSYFLQGHPNRSPTREPVDRSRPQVKFGPTQAHTWDVPRRSTDERLPRSKLGNKRSFADHVPRHRARRRRTLSGMATWPATAHELIQLQQALGESTPERWQPPTTLSRIGACFVCFERVQGAGAAGDAGFAGAAVTYRRRLLAGVASSGPAGGPYLPALLALREGPLLEQAVRALPIAPEVLVVNATGRDHPRCAGLALQLGAVLGLPTVGSRPGRWSPKAPGRPTSAVPRRRCGWAVSWWAAGSGPGRGPSRLPSTPPGRPTPRLRSRSCWPRPVVPAPQSPCAAPAPWPEPGGHTAAERVHDSRGSGRRSTW
jgi:Endonuclease V